LILINIDIARYRYRSISDIAYLYRRAKYKLNVTLRWHVRRDKLARDVCDVLVGFGTGPGTRQGGPLGTSPPDYMPQGKLFYCTPSCSILRRW